MGRAHVYINYVSNFAFQLSQMCIYLLYLIVLEIHVNIT